MQQHKIETANLLNNLKQKDEKIREERKRQLGMLNEKRERLHNAGKTPRTTPAPAAASKRKSWQYKPVAGTFFVYFFSAPRPPKNLRKLSFNIYFCELTYLNLQKSKTVHFCAILSTSKKKVMTSQWRSSELMIWQLHFYTHKNTVSISEQFHFLKHITVIMFTGK